MWPGKILIKWKKKKSEKIRPHNISKCCYKLHICSLVVTMCVYYICFYTKESPRNGSPKNWRNISGCHILVLLGELCALVREILFAVAPVGDSSFSESQGDKLDFVALLSCFC